MAMEKPCRWYQLRMTEYVREELPREEYNEVRTHLDESKCPKCHEHWEVEYKLQRMVRRRAAVQN